LGGVRGRKRKWRRKVWSTFVENTECSDSQKSLATKRTTNGGETKFQLCSKLLAPQVLPTQTTLCHPVTAPLQNFALPRIWYSLWHSICVCLSPGTLTPDRHRLHWPNRTKAYRSEANWTEPTAICQSTSCSCCLSGFKFTQPVFFALQWQCNEVEKFLPFASHPRSILIDIRSDG